MLAKVYDVLTQVFSKKGERPKPLLNELLVEQNKNEKKPMAYKSGADFEAAWEKINKG